MTGGRPLAALAGAYRFECNACGNRHRACPAATANALSSGDVSPFTELVVKSLYKSQNARTVQPRELAEFAAVFAAQGRVDHIAAVSKAMPLTFAPLAQRALRRFPPELPPTTAAMYKFATAGINTGIFDSPAASVDLTLESDSSNEDEAESPAGAAELLSVDEHILAQRTAGWTHWLKTGRLDHRGIGWQRKITYSIHRASALPIELCWHVSAYFVDQSN
jgi:hypothetical protein